MTQRHEKPPWEQTQCELIMGRIRRRVHAIPRWFLIYYDGDGFDEDQQIFHGGSGEILLWRVESKIRKYHKRTRGPRMLASLVVILALTAFDITTARLAKEVKDQKEVVAALAITAARLVQEVNDLNSTETNDF